MSDLFYKKQLNEALSLEVAAADKGHVNLTILESNLHGQEEISNLYLTYIELYQLAAALMDAHRATNSYQLNKG